MMSGFYAQRAVIARPLHGALLLALLFSGARLSEAQRSPATVSQVQPAPTSAAERAGPLPDAPDALAPDALAPETDVPDAGVRSANEARIPGSQTAPATGTGPGSSLSFRPFPERMRHYLQEVAGPPAFIAPAFESGIDTARPLKVSYPADGFVAPGQHPAHGSVPEWGEGAQGYAKRYADRFGQGLVGTTSRYALGEILREEVSYHRCQCTGLLPRTGYAMLGAYLAQTRGGHTVPSLPALASPFVASEVAVAAWYPGRFRASDALRISLLNYVAAPFKNLYAEFVSK